MQQKPSRVVDGLNRLPAAPVGALAIAATLLLAGLPAAAEAGAIAPQTVNAQVVTPAPVTPHVVAPIAAPASPVSPTGEAAVSAPTSPAPAAPSAPTVDAPGATQSPAASAPPASHPKTPAEKQKELLEQLRASAGFAPAPSAPERTSGWSIFDRVMAVVREYLCPRATWQRTAANVENTYEGGSCF